MDNLVSQIFTAEMFIEGDLLVNVSGGTGA